MQNTGGIMTELKKGYYLVKTTDTKITEKNFISDKKLELETLQELVGGYIQIINGKFQKQNVSIIMDEEGKLKENPQYNELATKMLLANMGESMFLDVVVGDVVVAKGFRS
tara:strand:- start:2222 stop:2554 length:333 start_codon:yes stop_codon:yes gene_type:complete